MITTTRGDMDEVLLERTDGGVDNDNEYTTWVEYRLPGQVEVIHRSVHVRLKKSPVITGVAGDFNG